METTEKIVEAYVRYIRKCATIPNIKCKGQGEIDILAINPATGERYHIEVTISISGSFKKLTDKVFDPERAKQRTQQASQRRTLGFFEQKKFGGEGVLEELGKYGFKDNYKKVIATYDATEGAKVAAAERGIELWYLPKILAEMRNALEEEKAYMMDDTMRTLHLFVHSEQGGRQG